MSLINEPESVVFIPDELNNHFSFGAYSKLNMLPVCPRRTLFS